MKTKFKVIAAQTLTNLNHDIENTPNLVHVSAPTVSLVGASGSGYSVAPTVIFAVTVTYTEES